MRTGHQLNFYIFGCFLICVFNVQGMSFPFEDVADMHRGCPCIFEVKDVHRKTHPSSTESMVLLLRALDDMMSKPGLDRYLEAGACG